VSAETQALIVKLRTELAAAGFDAGAHTISYHLTGQVDVVPSVTTIWRILCRHHLITPQPHKRPKSSFIRFQAGLPNEMWQMDATHWQLSDGTDVEILNLEDDHSRFFLASVAFPTVKAVDVVQVFHEAGQQYDSPASCLSDNGAVFSGRSRKGKVLLESELERLGIQGKHSTPYHPQTCGKVERLHQTLKKFLAQQAPAQSLGHLQLQLDAFRAYYNNVRPHRALKKQTPLYAFQRPPQGQTLSTSGAHPLPGPPRPRRLQRPSHPALPQPAAPHRHWPCPQEPAGPPPRRRRPGPRD